MSVAELKTAALMLGAVFLWELLKWLDSRQERHNRLPSTYIAARGYAKRLVAHERPSEFNYINTVNLARAFLAADEDLYAARQAMFSEALRK